MIRKVIQIATIALTTLAASVSTASAVEVHNPYAFALTGNQLSLMLHVPTIGEVEQSRCTNEWGLAVGVDGEAVFYDIGIDPAGVGPCSTIEDCDQEGWEGEIISEYVLYFGICLEGTGAGGDIGGHVACSVGDGWLEVHCDDSAITESFGLGGLPSGSSIELDGELELNDALSLEDS